MPHRSRLIQTNLFRKALLLIGIFCSPFTIFSQIGTTSPFSRYGIGEIKEGYAQNFSMAGLGAALQTDLQAPFNINLANPASFPYIRLTTFESAITSNTSGLSTGSNNQ